MSQIARDLRAVFGYLAVSWAAALAVRMGLPRVLGPEVFGRYTTADSLAQVVAVLTAWGFPAWVGREFAGQGREPATDGGAALHAAAVLALLALVGMTAAAVVLGYPRELCLLVGLVGLSAVSLQANLVATRLLEVARRYAAVRRVTVVSRLVWGVASVALFYAVHEGVVSPEQGLYLFVCLTAAIEAARTGASALLSGAAWRRPDARRMRRVLTDAAPFFVSNVFALIYWRLPALILSRSPGGGGGFDEMGLYGAGITLNGVVLMFVPALQAVILPRLAGLHRAAERQPFNQLVRTSLDSVIVLGGLVAGGLGLTARPLVATLFGPRYAEAWEVVLVSADTLFMTYVLIIFSFAFSCEGRERLLAWISVAGVPLTLAAAAVLIRGQQAVRGATAAACASAATEAVMLVVYTVVAARLPWLTRRTVVTFAAVSAWLAGGTAWTWAAPPATTWLTVLPAAAAFLGLYLAALLVTQRPLLRGLLAAVRKAA